MIKAEFEAATPRRVTISSLKNVDSELLLGSGRSLLEVSPRYMCGGTEETNKKHQLGY